MACEPQPAQFDALPVILAMRAAGFYPRTPFVRRVLGGATARVAVLSSVCAGIQASELLSVKVSFCSMPVYYVDLNLKENFAEIRKHGGPWPGALLLPSLDSLRRHLCTDNLELEYERLLHMLALAVQRWHTRQTPEVGPDGR